MQLQTKMPLSKQPHHQITYDDKIVLLGSCFSENIGAKFEYFKFQNLINPFGILFHPLAIETLITRAVNLDYYSEEDIHSNEENYFCFDAHSRLNTIEANALVSDLNSRLDQTHQLLKEASYLIITLGTAWVYHHLDTDAVVANCHKVPQKKFSKRLLTVDEISESLDASMALVKSVNPNINFIFTVSPVRHLKDGFVENSQSKAHLVSAVLQTVEPRFKRFYFPSYELMMDELRDYRFYDSDMIHPNDIAINYIWERFSDIWIADEAHKTMTEVATVQNGLAHRPFNPESEAHNTFLADLEWKKENLSSRHPHIQFG
ncbi:GSCFA domain-containing protein [Winogradskyella maritima]|uniref:GSCFA domain-containing protein n=1 Tax=Winogradskyella maritima TaxID=1517766 RepID=A0ABV8AJ75_9FLAO|nr:GSCFA domain-containing protein [Winogradskyella maritima]